MVEPDVVPTSFMGIYCDMNSKCSMSNMVKLSHLTFTNQQAIAPTSSTRYAEPGWCRDAQLSVGLWITHGKHHGEHHLSVLVGGLEPWSFMTFQKQLGISSSQLTNSIICQRDWNHPNSVVISQLSMKHHLFFNPGASSHWSDWSDFASAARRILRQDRT